MEVTIFAKKRTMSDGKSFYSYLTTLTHSDGSTLTVAVKFREDAGTPDYKKCPMNIIFDKSEANLSKRDYVREDTGEVGTSYTLWVSKWNEGSPYVDKSLDDFV